jgi:hypothetical protein
VGWVELEPWDRRARLARVHPRLKEDCLIAAGRTVPELRPEIEAQRSKEDRLRVVFRYFGDEGHPNPDPGKPLRHGPGVNGPPLHDCPTWERLPALEDETVSEKRPRGSAVFPRKEFNEAVRRLRAGENVAPIAHDTGISRNRLTRIRDRYVFPRPDGPEYEALAGPIRNTVILRLRF